MVSFLLLFFGIVIGFGASIVAQKVKLLPVGILYERWFESKPFYLLSNFLLMYLRKQDRIVHVHRFLLATHVGDKEFQASGCRQAQPSHWLPFEV